MELELNVMLVRDGGKTADGTQLYQLWGATPDSRTWLYCAVVVDLPKGIPIGKTIQEQARVVGYFFKLQSYYPAIAKPNEKPSYAPVIIGRMMRTVAVAPPKEKLDWRWGVAILGIVAVAAVGQVLWAMTRRKRRKGSVRLVETTIPKPSPMSVEDWFDAAARGDATVGNNFDRRNDSPEGTPGRNGDGNGAVKLFRDGLDRGSSQDE
jgi:hypothetical protein